MTGDGMRWLLRDNGSTNGLFVNGQRTGSHVLQVGDEIGMGQTVIRVV